MSALNAKAAYVTAQRQVDNVKTTLQVCLTFQVL